MRGGERVDGRTKPELPFFGYRSARILEYGGRIAPKPGTPDPKPLSLL